LKDYFLEDFYPLSGYGDITGADQWMAYQLDRPSDGTGIVVAFRRKESPDSTYTVQLRGLDSDATYRLSFDPDVAAPGRDSIRLGHKPDPALLWDEGRSWIMPAGSIFEKTGRELAEGLTLTLDKPRSSLLLRYSRKNN
jgi:alpha-galactosidase